jgi:DNA-binding Lrp family transcriptional regulator
VEAGKEDLFDRLYTNLNETKDTVAGEKIQFLYMAKCYTHSDISLLVEVKDPEALPPFIVNILLQMDGVWDIQLIPLLNPCFFELPGNIKKGDYTHYTVTLDVKANKTRSIYKHIKEMAASEDNTITFLTYSFYSFENDLILSFLAEDIKKAGKFVREQIRSMDGVIDTFLWQVDKWKFIISANDLLTYINRTRGENPISEEAWEKSYKALMDAYICAI